MTSLKSEKWYLLPSLYGRGKGVGLFLILSLLFVACGTKKTIESPSSVKSVDTSTLKKLDYVRKVYDNATYAKNIVTKIDFTIDAMGKNISVDGKLYMRKDE